MVGWLVGLVWFGLVWFGWFGLVGKLAHFFLQSLETSKLQSFKASNLQMASAVDTKRKQFASASRCFPVPRCFPICFLLRPLFFRCCPVSFHCCPVLLTICPHLPSPTHLVIRIRPNTSSSQVAAPFLLPGVIKKFIIAYLYLCL